MTDADRMAIDSPAQGELRSQGKSVKLYLGIYDIATRGIHPDFF